MKIPLAGSYTSRSVVAAAQQTMNLYPEAVEAPNEPTRLPLYGRPGIKFFAQTSTPKIRAMWAGGGRLFTVHGNTLAEVTEAGTVTNRTGLLAQTSTPGWPFPDPAQIFSNGHQLLIISGGKVYCDNGAGPLPAHFTLTGHGDTVNSTSSIIQSADDTDPFDASWAGTNMIVDGHVYTITAVNIIATPRQAFLDPAPPDMTNVIWEAGTGEQVTGITGGFLDGYFLVARPPNPPGSLFSSRSGKKNKAGDEEDPGRTINWSQLLDGTTWSPLDFGVKEGGPDYISSILCDHEELWVFGTETTEVWSNVGDANQTFLRNPGAFVHDGSAAIFAPCSVGLSICGLSGGANGQTIAFRIQGLQPQRISTHAQESEWNQAGFRVDDAVSFGYSENGHHFWVLNFWEEARTWVYDLTTGLWHERAGWNGATQQFVQYQPWYHAFVPEWGTNGKHIVGNPANGKLYEMSTNYTDDDGADIQYLRAFPHLLNEDRHLYHHRFELFMQTGVNPQMVVGLDWSNDGGQTFASYPAVPSLKDSGSPGDHKKRVVWRRLGKGRNRVYRVGVQGKGLVALVDAYLEATQGFA